MGTPIGDAPDFVRHPTPRFLGKINTTAGSLVSSTGAMHASLASQALLLTWSFGAIATNPPGVISVTLSDNAGNTWLHWQPGPPQGTVPLFIVPYFEALGAGFGVDVQWSVASPFTTELGSIYELDVAPAGWVYSPTWSKLPVDLNVTSFAPLPVELDAANAIVTVQGSTFAVPAVGVNIQPEVPGAFYKSFGPVLAVNATATIIPGVAGKRIFLYNLTWSMSTNAGVGAMIGQIQDSNLTAIDQIRGDIATAASQVGSPPHSSNMRGVALPLGSGLLVKNIGTLTTEFDGTVVYTQV